MKKILNEKTYDYERIEKADKKFDGKLTSNTKKNTKTLKKGSDVPIVNARTLKSIESGMKAIKNARADLPEIQVTANMAAELTMSYDELKAGVYYDIIGAAMSGKDSIRYSWNRICSYVIDKLAAQLIEDGYSVRNDYTDDSKDYVISWASNIKSIINSKYPTLNVMK